MDQIFFLFLLFNILFLIETKAINILVCFVGIMLTLAIQLGININLSIIDGQYFSYILILVQVSALTILFGFLLMLFPSLANSTPITLNTYKELYKNNSKIKYIVILSIILSIYILKININYNSFLNIINGKFYIDNFSPTHLDTEFIRKLGENIYSENNNIIKLILLTIILLFAIVALFFLIL